MTHVIVDRPFSPPLNSEAVFAMAAEGSDCFQLHHVGWHGSLLTSEGRRMICHFEGPDAESARIALRETGSKNPQMWSATVHNSPDNAELEPNVAVERSWDEAVAMEDIQAMEDAGAWCLDAYNVKFVSTYFSTDRKRMLCLYAAPDAESVRASQRQIHMPVDNVWPFELISPK